MSGSVSRTVTAYEVPLVPSTPQTLVVSMAGVSYSLTLRWNTFTSTWTLDIFDSTGVNPIVTGMPLVTGANLLEQYGYLGFGGALVAQTDSDPGAPPTWSNLGGTGHLFFVVIDG